MFQLVAQCSTVVTGPLTSTVDGGYAPVCSGLAATSQVVAHTDPRGSNICSTASLSEAECLKAVRGLLPQGQAQGRRNLVVVRVSS